MKTQTPQRKLAILLAKEAMAWSMLDSIKRKPGEMLKKLQRTHRITDEQVAQLTSSDFDHIRI